MRKLVGKTKQATCVSHSLENILSIHDGGPVEVESSLQALNSQMEGHERPCLVRGQLSPSHLLCGRNNLHHFLELTKS